MSHQFSIPELAEAFSQLVTPDKGYISVYTSDAADSIVEIFLQNGQQASSTGPFLESIDGHNRRVWHISYLTEN